MLVVFIFSPPISLPRQELEQAAIELLLRCIEHPRRRALVTTLLRSEIVIRGSTGPYIGE